MLFSGSQVGLTSVGMLWPDQGKDNGVHAVEESVVTALPVVVASVAMPVGEVARCHNTVSLLIGKQQGQVGDDLMHRSIDDVPRH